MAQADMAKTFNKNKKLKIESKFAVYIGRQLHMLETIKS